MTATSFAVRTASLFLATALPLALAACASEAPEQKPDNNTAGTGGSLPAAGTGGSTSAGQSGKGGSAGTGIAGTPSGGAGATGLGGAGASSGGAPAGGAGASSGGKSGGAGGPTAGTSSGGIGGAATGGIGGASSGGGPQGGSTGSGGGGAFKLESPNHVEGAVFADKYTCALGSFSSSVMPELKWSGAPAGTKSFAITFIDTTLSKKTPPDALGYHWAIYNLPATTMGLKEALMAADVVAPAKQTGAFLGPCPNVGGGTRTDNYEFTLYALAAESITLTGSGTSAVMNAETQLEASNLGKVKLTGSSSAKPK